MHQKKRLSLAVSAVLGLTSLAMIPGQVMAQDQQSEDDAEDLLVEEVIVTGSRLKTDDGFGQTSPVTVVGLEEISSTGLTRVEDVLNSLPQIEAAQTSFISNGSTGTASLDLRGLGANRTLVLVNGKRLQPGGVYTENVDVNQIPSAMIERVEVLTGGASATYGADAVAGVVNFIMRRVDGVELRAGISGYQHDNSNGYIQDLMDARGFDYPTGNSGIDGKAYNFDLVAGGDFADGRGNATVYLTWRKNNELRQEARDYSSCALSTSGTSCGGSSTAIVPNFFIYPIDADGNTIYDVDEDWFSLQPDNGLAPYDGSNIYNYAPINHFMRPDERWSAGAFLDFEINEHAVPYVEFMMTNDRTAAQIAESGTFYYEPYSLPLTNSLFPQGFRDALTSNFPGYDNFAIYIGKRNVEGGARSNLFQHTSWRMVAGTKGVLAGNWDYDVYYLHGQTDSTATYINDLDANKIRPRVDGEACAALAGCIPYEVFTYQGVTPEAAAQLQGVGVVGNLSKTQMFEAVITGNLGWGLSAGDIAMAFGYDWRKQTYTSIPDTTFAEGLLVGQGGPYEPIDGNYSVDELFIEANVPLLADVPFAEMLALDLAYRYSDYDTSGGSSTYRLGVDWQMVDMARIRAGYNRAVRAPNVNELFSTQSIGLWSGVDPCAGANPIYTQEQCARTGVTAAQYGSVPGSPADQYQGLFGGNPDLTPEEADTYTIGVVLTPWERMQFSIDYWNIEITDIISAINPELIIDQCALYGTLCDAINRAPNGNLWIASGYVESTNQNLAGREWEGVDFAGSWGFDALGGTFDLAFTGTWMLTKKYLPLPDDPAANYDCVGLVSTKCFATPEWRHNLSATYDSNGFWAVTGRWRYYDAIDYDGSTDLIADKNLGAQSYFDVSAVIRFMETHDVQFGVNNILDEEPPMVGGTLQTNANTISGFYDTLGRYLFANVTLRW